MATDIRPDEVSSILKKQLEEFETQSDIYEIGTILQVGDGIARVHGLSNAMAGELVEIDGIKTVKAIVLNLMIKIGIHLHLQLFKLMKN